MVYVVNEDCSIVEGDLSRYNNNFQHIYDNLTGNSIPESSSSRKEKNILFKVAARLINPVNGPITIIPIIADSSAKKMDYISTPFELIGK